MLFRKALVTIDLDKNHRMTQLLTKLGRVTALDFDWMTQFVYWAESRNHRTVIRRMNFINGSSVHANGSVPGEVVLGGLQTVVGVAVDWVARNLYWTERGEQLVWIKKEQTVQNEELLPREIFLYKMY